MSVLNRRFSFCSPSLHRPIVLLLLVAQSLSAGDKVATRGDEFSRNVKVRKSGRSLLVPLVVAKRCGASLQQTLHHS